MPRLRKRGIVGEVVEEKKAVSPEVEAPSASPTSDGTTATAARTTKGSVLKTKVLSASSENKVEATTPTGVVKKKPPTPPPQAKVGKGGIQKSFRDRLQWRSTHCTMPPTSTPIRNPRQKFTKEDIETAFGFDEDVEKTEYSTLVSPIAHASPKGINAPVWKIHPLSQRNVEIGVPKSRNPRPVAGPSRAARHPPQKRSNSEEAKGSPRVKVDHRPALVAPAPVTPKSQPQVPPTPPEAVHDKKTLELEVTPKPVLGDIELPSIIEVTPPASSSSHLTVPSSSEPSQTKGNEPVEVQVVKEKPKEKEIEVPAVAVPRRRGRPKKKVDYSEEKTVVVEEEEEPVPKIKPVATRSRRRPPSPGTEEQRSKEEELVPEPEPTKRPTRSTRSQKTVGVTADVPETASKLKSITKKKVAPKVKKPELEIQEIEADDEKEEHEVLLEEAPVVKRKRIPEETKSKKRVKSRTTKTAALFAPEKRPLLFENVTRQEDQPSGVSPFSQLVSKYKEEEMEVDGELRVDPRKIVRTYTSRKRAKFSEERDSEAEYDFIPKPTKSSAFSEEDDLKTTKKSKKGVKTKGKKKKGGEDDLDEETRKWLEQKNKEFDDVAKVKLVIEQSFSD